MIDCFLYADGYGKFLTAIITAVGLVLVLEGIIYALFPEGMQRMMMQMIAMPSAVLRRTGLVFAIIGCIIVWVVKAIQA